MKNFLRKSKGGSQPEDEDHGRGALFGNRTPATVNPATNPYARSGDDRDAYGAPQGGYGRGGDGIGNRGGYGGASTAPANPYASPRGGDDGRSRESNYGYGQQQQQQQEQSGSYGEEYNSEEEEIKSTKASINFVKNQSVRSTRNALDAALAAEASGLQTLSHLGTQGERLHNTEKNLNVASSQNRIAEERARELKSLNRSMFVPSVGNPLRSKSRAQEEEAKIIARHQMEREERDRTREFGYESKNVVGRALNTTNGRVESKAKSSLAERSRYQFEADEEDDAMEDEIDSNLDQLGALTGRLKGIAMATSKEVDRQNQQIDKIMKKVFLYYPI